MIRKCPFCKIVLNSGSGHIYKCKELDHPKSKEDIKFLYIEYNFPSISNKEILSREYFDNGKSLPDIKREYEIDYKSVLFLLKYYSLKSRTSSESSLLISVPKQRITMKEKYGIDWSSQLESVKEIKRANNNLKYGVDNIWKSQWFKDNLDKFYLEKYGIDRSQFNKNHWNSLSPIEQSNHMLKSALGSQNSSIELKIKLILDSIGIQYVSQKIIKENGKIYFFDICIKDIMIEINGDFWHANPYKYKSSDLLKFPKRDVLVSDIWKKDLNKKNCAIKNKYNVVYLWESYIKKTPNEKIIDDLIDIIENKNFIDKNEYKGIKN